MRVLSLDSTGRHCSAAVVRDGAALSHISEEIGRGHAEKLGPMVKAVLAEAGMVPADIDRVAVCTGPGSFTGLRVALAFAKGFALPRGLPVVGVDALRLEADRQRETGNARVGVSRDIRRAEVMFAIYDNGEPVVPPRAMTLEIAEKTADNHQAAIVEADVVDVVRLGVLAASLDPAEHVAEPLYSRAPDAKLPGGIDPNMRPGNARPA